MEQKEVKFQYEARYFQLGEITDKTKNLIFVLHGYGQQARYFLRKFKVLEGPENCIVAPEGLSRFYLEGFDGRVGATWMTRENRETDIINYLNYLNTIIYNFTKEQPNVKVTLLGFSQGAATASRWAAQKNVNFHQLILWAGIFPPDMNFEIASEKFREKVIRYIYGVNDPFLNAEKLEEMKRLSAQLNISPIVTTFAGEHDIDNEVLRGLF